MEHSIDLSIPDLKKGRWKQYRVCWMKDLGSLVHTMYRMKTFILTLSALQVLMCHSCRHVTGSEALCPNDASMTLIITFFSITLCLPFHLQCQFLLETWPKKKKKRRKKERNLTVHSAALNKIIVKYKSDAGSSMIQMKISMFAMPQLPIPKQNIPFLH